MTESTIIICSESDCQLPPTLVLYLGQDGHRDKVPYGVPDKPNTKPGQYCMRHALDLMANGGEWDVRRLRRYGK
jgi:hypothetical protein